MSHQFPTLHGDSVFQGSPPCDTPKQPQQVSETSEKHKGLRQTKIKWLFKTTWLQSLRLVWDPSTLKEVRENMWALAVFQLLFYLPKQHNTQSLKEAGVLPIVGICCTSLSLLPSASKLRQNKVLIQRQDSGANIPSLQYRLGHFLTLAK